MRTSFQIVCVSMRVATSMSTSPLAIFICEVVVVVVGAKVGVKVGVKRGGRTRRPRWPPPRVQAFLGVKTEV